MTIGNSVGKASAAWIAITALLLAPATTRARELKAIRMQSGDSLQDSQEARDKEQEKREREQEARERVQEKIERLQELYDDGREDLDEDRYDRAADKFRQLADLNGPQTDAALYWKAYAENRMGKRDTALATIADMKRRFPQSRWQKDATALEIEVKQSTGQPVKPADQSDEELKMLAIQGLMSSDPERTLPLLEKVINGSGTPKEKSKALFVLAQSGSAQAREILGRIARGQTNPDLQRKAVEYLGLFGGSEARKTLAEVYASSSDASVKHAILRSYMIGGDHEHLFHPATRAGSWNERTGAVVPGGNFDGSAQRHPAGIFPCGRFGKARESGARRKGRGFAPRGDSKPWPDPLGRFRQGTARHLRQGSRSRGQGRGAERLFLAGQRESAGGYRAKRERP